MTITIPATIDERVIVPSQVVETPPLTAEQMAAGLQPAIIETGENAGVPTQVANPSRASWRTFVQSVIPFLVALNIAMPLLQQFLVDNIDQAQQVLGPVYGYIVIGVNFAVIVLALGSKLIALLMANPKINALITKYLPFLAPIKPV